MHQTQPLIVVTQTKQVQSTRSVDITAFSLANSTHSAVITVRKG